MDREEFTKALVSVKAGLADKDIVEHSSSFVFANNHVITYNDQISMRYPLNIDIEGSVPAVPLLAFLQRVTKEEVTLEQKENELVIKCSRAKAGIPMVADIPAHLVGFKVPRKGWKKLPSTFSKAIGLCAFSASKDMTKPVLTNLHIGKDVIESSDNYRISQATVDFNFGGDVLIPATVARYISEFDHEACQHGSWVHFRNKDKAVMSCRMFAGEFPALDNFLEVKGKKITFPKKLKEILDRAGVFSKADFDNDRAVVISVKKERMKIRAESPEGWFEETVKASNMKDLSFSVHPDFLGEVLSIQKAKIILTDNAIVFKSHNKTDDSDFTHLVSL